MTLDGAIVLVTGGTGSLAHALVPALLQSNVQAIRLYSRNEHSQEQMQRKFNDKRLRFFIGDVRDRTRLGLAMQGCDYVINAAALKIVPTCAYNPMECYATNVQGAQNVIYESIAHGVKKVIGVSTDKAVEPVTLYGATKCLMENLFVHSNFLGAGRTVFSCVRYGNVVGSKGSILPLLLSQRKQNCVTLTDPRMTRFWMPIKQAVALILNALEMSQGGEIWVPKAPSMNVKDLFRVIAGDCTINTIGIRANEKLHEVLITGEESRRTREFADMYCVEFGNDEWRREHFDAPPVKENFRYDSLTNPWKVPMEQYVKDATEYLENH